MSTLSSVPEEPKLGSKIRDIILSSITWRERVGATSTDSPDSQRRKDNREAGADKVTSMIQALINQQIKSVFDELESELDDGKNSHSMKVISSAIQKIRSRYE